MTLFVVHGPMTPSSAAYPKKLFYKIQEVANIVGVEPYVLRYWETRFPMLNPEKDSSDQRRYRQKDIELLLRIRQLLHVEKYTIAGAIEKLKEETTRGGKRRRADQDEESGGNDLFDAIRSGDGGDAPDFETDQSLTEDQRENLRKVKDELGLLRRELEEWRDELG